MGITLVMLVVLACLLVVLATRIGLHEVCHRFDGEKPGPPGGTSIAPYWLTFRSTHDVTFEQDKEAFHDRAANFPTLELAMHGATRVNQDREARGQPPYTVVHSSGGMAWPLAEREDEGVHSKQHGEGGIHEPKSKAAS